MKHVGNYAKFFRERKCRAEDVLALLKRGCHRVKHKWGKGSFFAGGGYVDGRRVPDSAAMVCAVGAIWEDGEDNELRPEAIAVQDLMNIIKYPDDVFGWNDHPSTTKRQVLDFYRRIINKLEKDIYSGIGASKP